jgi:fructokinase
MKKTVVGLGEILWDIFPDKKELGGAPANFAYHISELGLNGYVISALGADELGDEILNRVKGKSLNYILERVPYPTGTVLVKVDENGVPEYEICENVAWDNIPFTKEMEELAKETDALCFGSLAQRSVNSCKSINQFIDMLPDYAMKVFDINLRQHFYTKQIIVESIQKSNVLKINDEELLTLSNLLGIGADNDEEKIVRELIREYQLEIAILTKGEKGSTIITPDESSSLDTPKVKVVDTVGAGDAFTAAFIAAILMGKSIKEAHLLAVDVSAYVCTQKGAMPKLPECYFIKNI